MNPTVVLVGTLDTKGAEYAFLRRLPGGRGLRRCSSTSARSGSRRPPADVPREEVAAAGGVDLAALTAAADRGAAVGAMCAARAGRRPPAVRRGALPGRARRRRVGQHRDRDGGDAGAARRRAQAHGVDDGRRATRPTTSASATSLMLPAVVDVAGLNSVSRAGAGQRRGRDGGHGRPRRGRVDGDARHGPVVARDHVRRHDARASPRRARSWRRARLRGARLPRHRHRRPGHGGAGRAPASSPACST